MEQLLWANEALSEDITRDRGITEAISYVKELTDTSGTTGFCVLFSNL